MVGRQAAAVSVGQDHHEIVIPRWSVRRVHVSSAHAVASTSSTVATDTLESTRVNAATNVSQHWSASVVGNAVVNATHTSAAVASCRTAAAEQQLTLDATSPPIVIVDLSARLASIRPAAVVVIRTASRSSLGN